MNNTIVVLSLVLTIMVLSVALGVKIEQRYYQGYLQGQADVYRSFAIKSGDTENGGGARHGH